MQIKKIWGIVLMISALLMQIGYASTTSYALENSSNTNVYFTNIEVETNSNSKCDRMSVEAKEANASTLNIKANNLYPGAKYRIKCELINSCAFDITVENIEINQVGQSSEDSTALYQYLGGYDNSQTFLPLAQYKTYLENTYKHIIIKSGGSLSLEYGMGLPISLTSLQSASTQYEMKFQFKQASQNDDDDDKDDDTDKDKDRDKDKDKDSTPSNNNNNNSNSNSKNGAKDAQSTTDGSTPSNSDLTTSNTANEPKPENQLKQASPIPTTASPIAKNTYSLLPKGTLPQTGGITAAFIYLLGFILISIGMIICKKGLN